MTNGLIFAGLPAAMASCEMHNYCQIRLCQIHTETNKKNEKRRRAESVIYNYICCSLNTVLFDFSLIISKLFGLDLMCKTNIQYDPSSPPQSSLILLYQHIIFHGFYPFLPYICLKFFLSNLEKNAHIETPRLNC